MKNFVSLFILMLSFNFVTAQPQFIVQGKIEFEKKVNIHKQLEVEEDDSWRNMMKKATPQIKATYFDLYFDNDKTIYKPGREVIATQKGARLDRWSGK
jgi:hypothetical protein